MASFPEQEALSKVDTRSTSSWLRRSLIALTILFWILIGLIILLFLRMVFWPILLFLIAAAFAYILFPLVTYFRRFMPRFLAILVTYIVVLIGISLLLYFIAVPVVQQVISLIHSLQAFNAAVQAEKYNALTQILNNLGISQNLLVESNYTLISQLQDLIAGIRPLVGSLFTLLIEVIIVSSTSIYLIVDGPRVIYWLKNSTPLKRRAGISLLVESLDRILGGFLRGVLFLATLMGVITTIGASIIGVPFPLLIGVIVFITEWIPQLGAYISGAIGVLFALTQGWQVALIYGIFASVVQGVLDAQVLAPRILGRSIGLHPVIVLFSLLIFGTLFGLLGAVLSIPITGVASVFVYASWKAWQKSHSDQFPQEGEKKEAISE